MQQQDDRPARGGRPSLLAPGEQAVPERQGILSSLDGLNAPPAVPARAAAPRRRGWAWGGAAAGAVLVGGALFLFADGEGDGDERHAQTVAAADAPAVSAPASVHAPAPAPAAASQAAEAPPAPAPAAVSAQAAASASEPVAAEVLAPAVVRDTAVPAGPIPNPLAELAPPPTKAERRKAAAHEKEEARRAADKRAEEKRAADKHAKEKRAEDKRAEDKRDKAAHKSRMQDSDVLLLTALMSHIDPKSRKATPAELLETCKRYNSAGEEQCRIRVCASTGHKEPACKNVPAPVPES